MQAFGCPLCAISLGAFGQNRYEQRISRASFLPPPVRHVGPLVLFFMLVSTMSLLAQQTATLSGMLTDSNKYPIERASVTLRNTGSNEIRQSLTDSTGRYTFTLLQAGTFEATGDKAGFKESTRPGINLAVGQSAVVDLQLMPGPASEQVFVNGDASQIGATLNETSGLITGE